VKKRLNECDVCDFENPVRKGRAHYCCPKCGRDYTLELIFWEQVAYPEVFEKTDKRIQKLIGTFKKRNKG